jgi:hypothetical protein
MTLFAIDMAEMDQIEILYVGGSVRELTLRRKCIPQGDLRYHFHQIQCDPLPHLMPK